MDIEQLRDYCLAKPGAEEYFPFGPDNLVFKVNGKMFLLASIDQQPLQFNVKCDPEKAIDLREQYSAVLPGYHMNKKLWNTVIIDGSLSTHQLKEFIDDSYELVIKGKKK
jgi:predicted DNA-binding protein (MmcQ/YjbR family)